MKIIRVQNAPELLYLYSILLSRKSVLVPVGIDDAAGDRIDRVAVGVFILIVIIVVVGVVHLVAAAVVVVVALAVVAVVVVAVVVIITVVAVQAVDERLSLGVTYI